MGDADTRRPSGWRVVACGVVVAMTMVFTTVHAQAVRTPSASAPAPGTTATVAPAPTSCDYVRPTLSAADTALLDDIQQRTFRWFWEATPAATGLVPDRHPSNWASSIAAIGFGLTAYPIGAERGWVTRAQARERTLVTLRRLYGAPQGPGVVGMAGYKGFYYHFLDMTYGLRHNASELSTVDTALLFAGVLAAQAYFDGDDGDEQEIRALAQQIVDRAQWPFMQVRDPAISMGWDPATGFLDYDWFGYNEALLVYLLALGSATHPVDVQAYDAWTKMFDDTWGEFGGQVHLGFAPLFGHQYTHAWVDLRGIRDPYMRRRGFDYFENSRRATIAQRAYAIENPDGWTGYGANVWGLTASDGPGDFRLEFNGKRREFRGYTARGAGLRHTFDDGTIAPTAAIGSMPFAPEIVIPAAREMRDRFREHVYNEHGFIDAFNMSFRFDEPSQFGRVVDGFGWVGNDRIGIDQGPILVMIENYRTGMIWDLMKTRPVIREGLRRAGFTGGWLDACGEAKDTGIETQAAPEKTDAPKPDGGA